MVRSRIQNALQRRFGVDGEDMKVQIVDIFDVLRNGDPTTVALLRYVIENDLTLLPISELFERFSVFWTETDADRFISGQKKSVVVTAAGSRAAALQAATADPATAPDRKMSNRIRQARIRARLTQAELGVATKVPTAMIKGWEAGSVVPAGDDLVKLAGALGTTVIWLRKGRR